MNKNQFDWIPFYEEFADKLLAYKDNRQELIEKIKHVYEVTGIKLPRLERIENGDNEIVDIDPFTTFGLFNKGITDANRVKICTAIKDLFEVSSPVPTYFDGIPVLNNQMATFYWFGNGRGEHDIDNLWDVFDYALALSNTDTAEVREKFSNSFNASLSQKGVKWNLSMDLYWIRPNRFLNLDSRNRWFIINNDSLPESVVARVRNLKSMPEAEEYLAICDECLSYIHSDNSPYDSLSALSFSAWSVSKQDDGYEKLTEDSSANSGAKFLRWFRPLLQALKDLGGSATPKEARNKIIENEKLTEEETSAVIGKTQTPEFNNDVAWARQYLVKGGYLDNNTRGIWKLTEAGWTVDMTDKLATELFIKVIKENQKSRNDKGYALADEDYLATQFTEKLMKHTLELGWSCKMPDNVLKIGGVLVVFTDMSEFEQDRLLSRFHFKNETYGILGYYMHGSDYLEQRYPISLTTTLEGMRNTIALTPRYKIYNRNDMSEFEWNLMDNLELELKSNFLDLSLSGGLRQNLLSYEIEDEDYDEMEFDLDASAKLRIHHTQSLYSDWTLGTVLNYRPDSKADQYKDFYIIAALNYEF